MQPRSALATGLLEAAFSPLPILPCKSGQMTVKERLHLYPSAPGNQIAKASESDSGLPLTCYIPVLHDLQDLHTLFAPH